MSNFKYIEVFTTNVKSHPDAALISAFLGSLFDVIRVSFDLNDADRVLRIASSKPIDNDSIIRIVKLLGYQAYVMPDVIFESIETNG